MIYFYYIFFSGIAIHVLIPSSKLPVLNENLYSEGDVVLQNLPSIVCGWVVDARPGETILDMCAAPGNKTTHLAEMASDQVHYYICSLTLQHILPSFFM